MVRWIAVLAVLLLAGCASTRPHYYDDGYYAGDRHVGDGYYADRYDGAYYDDGYYGDSGYYRGGDGYGDYYYSDGSYSDRSYRYPSYFDSPYYYSLFWPLNRWSYDPYWYPNYYYGVTWFPRNYFSVGLSFGGHWSHHGGFAYSPYRYGWADWYYDWSPWYHRYGYGRHYDRPRFGNAAHEAERLAGLSGRGSARSALLDARSSAMRGDRGGGRFDAGIRGDRGLGRFDAGARSGRGALPQRVGTPSPRRQATSALPRSERGTPGRRGSGASDRPLRREGALLRSEAESGSASRARIQALRGPGARPAQARDAYARQGYDREGYAMPRARQPARSAQRALVAPRGSRAPYDVDAARSYAPRSDELRQVQVAPRGYERRVDAGAVRAPLPERSYRSAPRAAAPAYAPAPQPAPAPRRYESRDDSGSGSYAPAPRARSGAETRSPRRGRRDDP